MTIIESIPLSTPIKRGETEITTLQLRKPNSVELRGISLAALLQLDADAVMQLLPRITNPTLTEPEVWVLDVSDFTACGLKIAAFLLPASMRPNLDSPTPNSDSLQP